MKWYPIKKYMLVTFNDYILRAVSKKQEYERYFIARCEHNHDLNLLPNWDLSNDCYSELNLSDYEVTHFAAIEPVLKDEE